MEKYNKIASELEALGYIHDVSCYSWGKYSIWGTEDSTSIAISVGKDSTQITVKGNDNEWICNELCKLSDKVLCLI